MISSSLAVGTLSKAALCRKQRVSGSDVAGSDSIAFVTGGAAGVGPAYKIRKRIHPAFEKVPALINYRAATSSSMSSPDLRRQIARGRPLPSLLPRLRSLDRHRGAAHG